MFVIRRARIEDVSTLLKLARMVHFINLPPDREVIAAKVTTSRLSFARAAGKPSAQIPSTQHKPAKASSSKESPQGLAAGGTDQNLFLFILENTESGAVLGTSQVLAQMGGPGNPNYAFKLEKRDFFADDIKTGTSHVVARLHKDESGPTEIGGLILQPASRGANLGRFLSFVRFHFIGLHRQLFADRVLGEMMAPITDDGRNLLWEYLGRRFIPLSYVEADTQCQRSRQFIANLLPHEDIYLSLLPPEAREVVGSVHRETVPAKKLLEKLGFTYRHCVDPFDGGPHLDAPTDEIPLVKHTHWRTLNMHGESRTFDRTGILSVLHKDGEFLAVQGSFAFDGEDQISLPNEALSLLRAMPGMKIGVTDLTDGIEALAHTEPAHARARV